MFHKEGSSVISEGGCSVGARARAPSSSSSKTSGNGKKKGSNNKNATKKNESSSSSNNNNKAMDVPLRKSDRKAIMKEAIQLFRGVDDEGNNNTEIENNKVEEEGKEEQHQASSSSSLLLSWLKHIFVDEGTLSIRKLVLSNGTKVQLYMRSPSSLSSTTTFPTAQQPCWPYTRSSQCVWIHADMGRGEAQLNLPTVALLSVVVAVVANSNNASESETTSTPTESIVPTVLIPAPASKYLCRGAHLMRAGILDLPRASSAPSKASEGTTSGSSSSSSATNKQQRRRELLSAANKTYPVVAVAVQGNPQPFAVGVLTAGTTSNNILNGSEPSKGIGVEIWTCYGDDLWRNQAGGQTTANAAQKTLSPTDDSSFRISPIGGTPYDEGNYGNVGFVDGAMVHPIRSTASDEKEGDESKDPVPDLANEVTTSDDAKPGNEPGREGQAVDNTDKDKTPPTTSDDYDQVLHSAVCRALVNISDKQLPMLSASFYAQHVIPQVEAGKSIELKKTQWKKLGPYLQEKAADELIAIQKDATNPAAAISRIYRRHPDLKGLVKDKTVTNTGGGGKGGDKRKLAVVTLYIVPHHFVPLLRLKEEDVKGVNAKSEFRRGTGMLTAPEVRNILNDYIDANELLQGSMTQVHLDGPLTDALFGKKNKSASPDTMSRKDITEQWMSKMEAAHALVEMPGSKVVDLKRGSPPKVTITVEARQGRNKFVTRVRGMEEYGIVDTESLCQDVAKRFACAGAVVAKPEQEGRAALKKKGRVELTFQGHLLEELKALLIGDERLSSHGGAKNSPYAIPKQVIEIDLKKNVPAKKRKK